jgi:hypothetical protein
MKMKPFENLETVKYSLLNYSKSFLENNLTRLDAFYLLLNKHSFYSIEEYRPSD